ncbi:hypothetical protein [Roseibium sp.]|uniref:hypothetical protein n=1 Tax=Roseibium sp. TaxID=1936156 RepID=UPI003A972A20
MGRFHALARNQDDWNNAWANGTMMRYASTRGKDAVKYEALMELALRAKHGDLRQENLDAWIKIQNLTRSWIEELAVIARDLRYDALIGREVDNDRSAAPDVLFALTANALTSPIWLD